MNTCDLRTNLSIFIAVIAVAACGGRGDSGSNGTARGANGSYLFVTHQSQVLGENSEQILYYGSQDVGATSSYAVRIANRGADVYPLKSLSIMPPLPEPETDTKPGRLLDDNSEEFAVQFVDNIVLQPAEAITVSISFTPITQGEKHARFVVDYETIHMVDESVNVNEQAYYQANDLEAAGRFRSAADTYNDYLDNEPVTSNKRRAAIRLPIIDEAQSYDGEEDLGLYLQAMREREENNLTQSLRTLDVFAAMYPESYLADDAHYLKGYIQLIDQNDPQTAMSTLQDLRESHPDTSYYDTALYSEAIAHSEMGNDALARNILEALKLRHTGIDTLGIQLPKDNLVSRMWFERATQMLDAA